MPARPRRPAPSPQPVVSLSPPAAVEPPAASAFTPCSWPRPASNGSSSTHSLEEPAGCSSSPPPAATPLPESDTDSDSDSPLAVPVPWARVVAQAIAQEASHRSESEGEGRAAAAAADTVAGAPASNIAKRPVGVLSFASAIRCPLALGASASTSTSSSSSSPSPSPVMGSSSVYRQAAQVVNKRCAESKEMREMASRICRDYLHGAWKQISARDIVLKRISGGLSNWLYHVSLPGGEQASRGSEPSQVLLRLYGELHGGEQGVEGLITESVIFTLLSERRLGPCLHGVFPGGRIEEYIPARPLKTSELADPKLSPLIAEKMAGIHSMNVPISKEPNWLWDTMNRWLQNVMVTLRDPAPHTNAQNAHIISRLASMDLAAEAKWLKKFLVRVNSPVVFCHNDMQEGNILMVKESSPPRLVLIDFEYCSYNYRAFDLANHFLEWTYDYTLEEFPHFKATPSAYPTSEQQLAFVRAYLQTAKQQQDHNTGGTIDSLPPGQHPTEEEAALLKEVRAFSLISHLFWGFWSIVNATVSQIPFGYWEYAEERINSYLEAKASLTSMSESVGVKRKTDDVD